MHVMDMIPLDNLEPMEDNSYLSDRAVFARDKAIERRLSRPKQSKRETLLEKYHAALELIGGVPRLAIMADEDPLNFMSQLIRLEIASQTKNVSHSISVIQPAIPPTALDGDDIQDIPFSDVSPNQE